MELFVPAAPFALQDHGRFDPVVVGSRVGRSTAQTGPDGRETGGRRTDLPYGEQQHNMSEEKRIFLTYHIISSYFYHISSYIYIDHINTYL